MTRETTDGGETRGIEAGETNDDTGTGARTGTDTDTATGSLGDGIGISADRLGEPRLDDPIQNRSEIVFFYDAVDCNPNGDPRTEENRPRVDPHTEQGIVTNARLKRVVRDYADRQGEAILIKKSGDEGRDDKDDRYAALRELMEPLMDEDGRDMDTREAFLAVASDVRLFGETLTFDSELEGNITGPAQINDARTTHRVYPDSRGRTSVVATNSEEGDRAQGGNMFTEHKLAYGMFRSHAVINEHNAAETHLGEADRGLFLDGLWYGTRNETNTTSKKGHEPRLLVHVEYDRDDYHIGDLHRALDFKPAGMDDKEMRDVDDGVLLADEFVTLLDEREAAIEAVEIRASRRLTVSVGDTVQGGPFDLELAVEDALDEGRVEFSVE